MSGAAGEAPGGPGVRAARGPRAAALLARAVWDASPEDGVSFGVGHDPATPAQALVVCVVGARTFAFAAEEALAAADHLERASDDLRAMPGGDPEAEASGPGVAADRERGLMLAGVAEDLRRFADFARGGSVAAAAAAAATFLQAFVLLPPAAPWSAGLCTIDGGAPAVWVEGGGERLVLAQAQTRAFARAARWVYERDPADPARRGLTGLAAVVERLAAMLPAYAAAQARGEPFFYPRAAGSKGRCAH